MKKPISIRFRLLNRISFIWMFIYLLFSGTTSAQKENNIWAFGDRSGLDFNSGSPVPIICSLISNEGASSVSSSTGSLLFYSDGLNVWDRTHNKMPNGTGLIGNNYTSCTQGVIIGHFKNDPDLYFLFGLEAAESSYLDGRKPRLSYSVVDMKSNGGLGDILPGKKNIVLDSGLTESMTIVKGNGCYFWVIVHLNDHPLGSDQWNAYKVDYAGVSSTPVVSHIGTKVTFLNLAGDMRASPDGKLLFRNSNNVAELFDFNNATGVISNARRIDSLAGGYENCFSPDGSKLYYSARPAKLFQVDLSLLPSITAVQASKTLIADTFRSLGGTRLGPDNKIYIIGTTPLPSTKCLIAINDPNKGGTACNLTRTLMSGSYKLSLGENPLIILDSTSSKTHRFISCAYSDTNINIAVKPNETFIWNDGDTARTKKMPVPGKIWLITKTPCWTTIDTFIAEAASIDTVNSLITIADCKLSDTLIKVSVEENTSWEWSDKDTSTAKRITAPSILWLTVRNGCNVKIDTYRVEKIKMDSTFYNHIITSCTAKDTIVSAPEKYKYLVWNDGDIKPQKLLEASSVLWATSINNCDIRMDTFRLHLLPFDTLFFKVDTTVCKDEAIKMAVKAGYEQYIWWDNDTSMFKSISQSGTYWYRAEKYCAVLYDTLFLSSVKCRDCMVIPNAFTPNNDSRNDDFKVISLCPTFKFSMIIVNRYGEKVFVSENTAQGWDGNFNGLPAEIGTYFYLIKTTFDIPDKKDYLFKGDITLIR